MRPIHGIQNEKEGKVWKGGRICNKNKRSLWGSRNSVKKELEEDDKVYR